jgi:hypothetical protein
MATQVRRNPDCSDAERLARQDLAACYRIFDMLGWSESIYNHITLRVPGEEAFLINPFGLLWSEVTASNLVKIDSQGNKLCASPYPVNLAGFTQHSVFHKRLPWATRSSHAHPRHDGGVLERGRADADQLLFVLLRRRDRLSRLRGHHRARRGR